jgi:hypothetical protein
MRSTSSLERRILKRWPELKQMAEHEFDPDKLLLMIEEVEGLLFKFEMKVASDYGNSHSTASSPSRNAKSGSSETKRQ